jgi:hypothetical protein
VELQFRDLAHILPLVILKLRPARPLSKSVHRVDHPSFPRFSTISSRLSTVEHGRDVVKNNFSLNCESGLDMGERIVTTVAHPKYLTAQSLGLFGCDVGSYHESPTRMEHLYLPLFLILCV